MKPETNDLDKQFSNVVASLKKTEPEEVVSPLPFWVKIVYLFLFPVAITTNLFTENQAAVPLLLCMTVGVAITYFLLRKQSPQYFNNSVNQSSSAEKQHRTEDDSIWDSIVRDLRRRGMKD